MELLSPRPPATSWVACCCSWLAFGVHIGVALGLAGFIGIYLTVGPDAAAAQIAAIPFSTTNNFALAVIPLFILMGSFATRGGHRHASCSAPRTCGSASCAAGSPWRR